MVISAMENKKTGKRAGGIGEIGCEYKLSDQWMPDADGDIWIKTWGSERGDTSERLEGINVLQAKEVVGP